MQLDKIENLVFNGGGFRGIAFIGVLQQLESLNFDKKQIKKILGTSIGSVLSFLYIIGYSPDELLNIVLDKNFKDFCNLSITTLIKDFGLDNGNKIVSWLEQLTEEKGISKNITFKEIKQELDIEINITCSNLNFYKAEILNYKNCPDLEIIKAIRMSIAVPFIFTPVKWKENLYVDGALLSKFPLELFSQEKEKTLAIKLEEDKSENKNSIKNIYDFGYHVLKCIISKSKIKDVENFNILSISIDQKDFLNFQMSASKKLEIFIKGQKCAQIFCEKNKLLIVKNDESSV